MTLVRILGKEGDVGGLRAEIGVKQMNEDDDKAPRATRVQIFGREYLLQSDESAEYAHTVASYVDQRMAEIASRRNLADPARAAIMAAMEIADELLQRRDSRGRASDRAAEALDRLGRRMDGTQRG